MKTIFSIALFVVAATSLSSFAQSQEAPRVTVLPPGATVVGFDPGYPLIVSPQATTVQLPTFNFFTVQTSVLVPNRGGIAIGGINRASSYSHSNGPPGFGQTARGSSLIGGDAAVGVQVIDLQEMDRQLLGQAAKRPDAAAINAWAVRMEQARHSSAGRPTVSVAEARRLRAAGEAR